MASDDAGLGEAAAMRDDQPRPEMQAQVLLDRAGFAPSVIDGTISGSTHNALRAFQRPMAWRLPASLTMPRAAFSRGKATFPPRGW
jgi:peptidoglycan hydrolase-like protein with peptidoglycan-binding domain